MKLVLKEHEITQAIVDGLALQGKLATLPDGVEVKTVLVFEPIKGRFSCELEWEETRDGGAGTG